MSDNLEFKISEGLVMPIIKAKIETAIIEAMGGHEELIYSMLDAFMKQKVSADGKPAQGYRGDIPRLEYLTTKMVESAMKEALSEFLKNKQELMRQEFEKYFKTKKGSAEIAKAMQKGLCQSFASDWRMQFKFELLESRD